jgi:hypothetical protein
MLGNNTAVKKGPLLHYSGKPCKQMELIQTFLNLTNKLFIYYIVTTKNTMIYGLV